MCDRRVHEPRAPRELTTMDDMLSAGQPRVLRLADYDRARERISVDRKQKRALYAAINARNNINIERSVTQPRE